MWIEERQSSFLNGKDQKQLEVNFLASAAEYEVFFVDGDATVTVCIICIWQ